MAKSLPKTDPGAKKRFEGVVDYMLTTPPKTHQPLGKKRRAKAKKKASAP